MKSKNKKLKIAIFHPWVKSRGGAEKTVLELLKNLKDSELYTYRGIIINPFLSEDALMKFSFSTEKDILALQEEFIQIVKPEYRFLSDKLFYKVCPFIINRFS